MFLQTIILFMIVYLCTFSIVNRVCCCIERCRAAKAYLSFKENETEKELEDEK